MSGRFVGKTVWVTGGNSGIDLVVDGRMRAGG